MPSLHRALLFTILATATVLAQTAPLPLINQPLVPASAAPGGGEFYLTVTGQGFAPDAVLNWNGSTRVTIVNSGDSLQAVINAIDIAKQGTASITVTNPAPGGGTSNVVYFPIRRASSSVAMAGGSAFAGGTVVIGDFNNDGIPDVAVVGSNPVTGQLNIMAYLGKGNGTFSAPLVSTAYDYPEYIFVGDVNGDGKLDLLVGSGDDDGYGSTDVYFGNGDGTFTWTTGMAGAVEAVGDWNGDGKLDVVVAYYDEDLSYSAVFLGDGTGNFPTQSQYEIGYYGDAVLGMAAVGDFNGDGKLDLAFPGVGVALGNGDGTFQNPIYYSNSYFGDWLVTADINGDGKLDLITSGLAVLLGNGDGTFTSAGGVNLGNPYSNLVIGDFNGDGKLDLIVMDDYATGFQVLLGNGDGTFQTPVDTKLNTSLSFDIGDFNGDGKTDVVVSTIVNAQSLMSIYLSNGDGSFTLGAQYTGPYGGPSVADVNGDGKLDLVISGEQLLVMLGNGNGTFQNAIPGPEVNNSTQAIIRDFDGDGKPDFVAGTYEGIVFLKGNGNGTFQNPVYSIPIIQFCCEFTAEDVNGDGKLDLVSNEYQDVFAMLGNGDGTFQPPVTYSANGQIYSGNIVVGDFNSDGIGDIGLIFQDVTSGTTDVSLYLSTPTVAVSPSAINFGSVKVGQTSSAVPIQLTNVGNGSLAISGVTVSGDFLERSDCAKKIATDGTCSIKVQFKPEATGALTGEAIIKDNALGATQQILLTGTGH